MFQMRARAMAAIWVIAFGAVLAFCAPANAQDRITIGTNPAGTFYNQLGGAITSIVQDKTGAQATTRPFSGTSVYLPLLQRGEIPFGINSALDTWNAYSGSAVYQQPMANIRVAMLVYRAPYGYFVRASSGMKSVADLKGKRVIVTQRAIASFDKFNEALLASAGLTPADVTPVTVSGVAESVRALKEDRADAVPVIIGFPLLREADAAISGGLRVLALGSDDSQVNALPGINTTTLMPAKPLVGVKEPTKAARFDVYLNTGTDISADAVYSVVKTTYENWGSLQKDLPPLRPIQQSDLAPAKMSVPFHDGSVRFLKEAGVWTAAHQARQDQLLAWKPK